MITGKQRFAIFVRDRFRCRYCGASSMDGAALELDHVIPQVDGGSDDDENLVTACRACNNGKRADFGDDAANHVASLNAETCVTPLLIATKADQLGLSYREVREVLQEAGRIVPPPAPHRAATEVADNNRQWHAEMMGRALYPEYTG